MDHLSEAPNIAPAPWAIGPKDWDATMRKLDSRERLLQMSPFPQVSGEAFEAVRGGVDQRSSLGHQVCCQLAGRRRGAEAVPGKTGGQG